MEMHQNQPCSNALSSKWAHLRNTDSTTQKFVKSLSTPQTNIRCDQLNLKLKITKQITFFVSRFPSMSYLIHIHMFLSSKVLYCYACII